MVNLLSLTIPIVLMQIYDRIIAYKSYDTLLWLTFGGAAAVILEGVFRTIRSRMSSWIGSQFEFKTSKELYQKMICGNSTEISSLSDRDLLDSFNSVSKLRQFYAGQEIQILMDIPFVILFLGVVGYLNFKIMIFVVFVAIIYSTAIWLMRKRLVSLKQKQSEDAEEGGDFLIEILSRFHLIKTFSVEERILRKMEYYQDKKTQSDFKMNMLTTAPESIGFFAGQVVLFGAITISASEIIQGDMTVGAMTACTLIAGRTITPVKGILSFWLKGYERNNTIIKLNKLKEVSFIEESELLTLPDSFEGRVVLTNVSYQYNDMLVLDDTDLILPKHSFTGILADEKSGTTTLARLICGVLTPKEGKVLYDHYDINEIRRSSIGESVAYVPAQGAFFKGTILDNLTMYDESKSSVAYDAAAMIGLDPIISMLPKGYDTVIDSESSSSLSSGLLQRITVARALATRPKVIVFDKTNHSMDSQTEENFTWLLKKLKGRITVVLISRKTPLFDDADNLFRLRAGKLLVKRIANHG
ncbi:MAG: ATP-binding cassette domain-containing protein [Bacteriovoracaceae bacterium]|nr:ATP-binding cassette domain-containing protein [Bacteriovoracaceae bacterium]